MSNFLVHGTVNTIAYIAVAFLLQVPLSWGTWFLVVLTANIFDLDHLPFFFIKVRPLTVENLKKILKEDYEGKIPHFYLCHTLEFELALAILTFIFWPETWLAWMFGSWTIHLVTDIVSYLVSYRSVRPWGKFWIATYYFAKGKMSGALKPNTDLGVKNSDEMK